MDRSPLMYEIDEQSFFKDKLSQGLAVGEISPTLEELETSLELAVDVQGIINSNLASNPHQDIFAELLATNSDQTNFAGNTVALQNLHSPSVDSQDDNSNLSVQMPHLVQYYDHNNYLAEVKSEPSAQEVSTLDLTTLLAGNHFPFEGVTVAEATSTQSNPIPEAGKPQVLQTKPNSLKATPPSKSRRKAVPKGSDEYREKRERNNVAVRKSRDKAKIRQLETEDKVHGLTDENQKLQKKVDLLSKELAVLRSLFTNVGAALPDDLRKQFELLAKK